MCICSYFSVRVPSCKKWKQKECYRKERGGEQREPLLLQEGRGREGRRNRIASWGWSSAAPDPPFLSTAWTCTLYSWTSHCSGSELEARVLSTCAWTPTSKPAPAGRGVQVLLLCHLGVTLRPRNWFMMGIFRLMGICEILNHNHVIVNLYIAH